ncbi:MAG: hypothetical protein ABI380_09690 [Edaphobacter sp.]
MRIILLFTFLFSSIAAFAQQQTALPEAPVPAQVAALDSADPQLPTEGQPQSFVSASGNDAKNAENYEHPNTPIAASKQQPKRILGIMPNYRAVSAGEIPPPPTPKQAFVIATKNSFDYSSFFFVGITSMIAEGQDAHPALGKGLPGFWGYSWRGFVDKTDGNYLVIFALPSLLHEDGRYFAKGEGSIFKRAVYASSRVAITRTYGGNNTFNASEIFGRGAAQAISTTYYPSNSRTVSELSERYAYALMRDALTNTFREFWPDIATHVLHRHP